MARRKERGVEPCDQSPGLPPLLLTLTWLETLGYAVILESDLAIKRPAGSVDSQTVWLLPERLYQTLQRINPDAPSAAIATAIEQLIALSGGCLLQKNQQVHDWLIAGMHVNALVNGQRITQTLHLIDRVHLLQNDWLVLQRTGYPGTAQQQPDLIVFINGLPLAVIQGLPYPGEKPSLREAYEQLQTYQRTLPTLLAYNALLVMTDGQQARVGTLTSRWPEFLPWVTIDGEVIPVTATTELEVLIQGVFDRRRFLELVQSFLWFEQRGMRLHKAIVNYPFCPVPQPLSRRRWR